MYINITDSETKHTRLVYLKYSKHNLNTYLEKYKIFLTGIYKKVNKYQISLKFHLKSEKYDYMDYIYLYPFSVYLDECDFSNFEKNTSFFLLFITIYEDLQYFELNINNKINKLTYEQFSEISHNSFLIHYKINRKTFEEKILNK